MKLHYVALAFAAASPCVALAASTPFSGTPIALPATIPAANFDKGGEGAGYHDMTSSNLGGLYRTSEGVDIYSSTDPAGAGYQVQNFQTGEWMSYTVSVAASGNYDIGIRASNNYSSNCAFHIEVDGVNVTGSVKVPVTGSWTTYQLVGKQGIALTAGTHVIRVVSDAQWFNVSALAVATSATQPTAGGSTSTSTSTSASSGYAGTPYSGAPIGLPLAFPSVNFDKGGQGVAYKDMSAGNSGGLFRTSEDVDIYASTDTVGGPYQVANIQTGEWMNYTVSVPANGNYDVSVHASNNYATSVALHVEIDGVNVTGSLKVPMTGSWTTYQWVGKAGVPLTAGKHVLKVFSDQQYFNMNAVSVLASTTTAPSSGSTATSSGSVATLGGTSTSASYAGTPYSGTPVTVPATIMAANFDKGGQGVAYKDMTAGNAGGLYRTSEDVDIISATDGAGGGYAINSFQTGEWMNYTINVPSSGSYDLGIRAATNYSLPTSFHMEVDGANVTGAVPVPVTGDWGTFQWAGKQGVPLTAGTHVLKVAADAQYFNMSAVTVAASGTSSTPTSTPTSTTGGTTTASGGGTSTGGTTPPSSLLFWAGYESATSLGSIAASDCWGNGCWQNIVGSDSATGYTWPPKVSGGSAALQLLANPSSGSIDQSSVGSYTWAQIQNVTGHKGNSTRALYQEIDQMGGGSTQAPFMINPAADVPELYISQWVKLQPDMLTKMAAGTWRDLFEWKTYAPGADTDYRVELAMVNYGGGTPIWQMRGDGWVPSYTEYWRIQNTSVPVPIGQWFKLEVYWKRSSGSDGRVWMAVNGQVIGDHLGPNMGPANAPINRIMAAQLYSGSSYPIYQWTDDLQIWSTFPTASSGNPWYDPPYAPH
jgi:uncharacterized protein YaiE (UPF0345 family)